MKETIVFCVPGNRFTEKFMKSWTDTIIWCLKEEIYPVIVWQTGADVFQVRNKSFGGEPRFGHLQKPFQGKIPYDYIMMIDSDQVWTVSHFQKILHMMRKNSWPALTGVYPRVSDTETKFSTIMKVVKSDVLSLSYKLLSYDEINDRPKPCKVDASGLGFCMIRKGVVEKLTYPWFTAIPVIDKKLNIIVQYTAEDLAFWLKLKEVGIDLWCDTSLRIGHEKNRVFNGGI